MPSKDQRIINSVVTAYKHYKKITPKEYLVSRDIFMEVCYAFLEFSFKKLLDTGQIYFGDLGLIYIMAKKNKKLRFTKNGNIINLPINWVESKKQGKWVYNENFETDGRVYKFSWAKLNAEFKTKEFYKFFPCRNMKKTLCALIKEEKMKFEPETIYLD